MTSVVVVADPLHEDGLARLRAARGLEVVLATDEPAQLAAALARAHALIVRSETTVTAGLLAAAPHLRVVGRAGVGVDNVDVDAATARGIAVLNVPGGNTVSAAEHTLALLLALVRQVPMAAASMRDGAWERKRFLGSELRGKQLGLLGLGRIGQQVATVAKALGMVVVAHDPALPPARAEALDVPLLPLDELLAGSDVVSLHLPLTEETRGLMNAARLERMRPSAVLVNVARGALVDQEALLEAVERRELAGAALDVFEEEPLPPGSPLRTHDRLLLTPHIAASTREAQQRVAVTICEYVRDALLTGARPGLVNPGVGGA